MTKPIDAVVKRFGEGAERILIVAGYKDGDWFFAPKPMPVSRAKATTLWRAGYTLIRLQCVNKDGNHDADVFETSALIS